MIPSLKARPEWLPWALDCIGQYSGHYEELVTCIVEQWHRHSHRTKAPSRRNSLRAVFGPTLRHLQLALGEGANIRLTAKGKDLLSHYKEGDEPAFKRILARHLVKLDNERWIGVISKIKMLGENVSHERLLEYLQSTQEDSQLIADRLRKLINYFAYAGVLNVEGGYVNLRLRQLQMIKEDLEPLISDEEFISNLLECYKTFAPGKYGNPYVPIPELREAVCEKMDIWPDDFDKMLQQAPRENSRYLIHLTQPMSRKVGGIKIHDKYLYYVAIILKRDEGEA